MLIVLVDRMVMVELVVDDMVMSSLDFVVVVDHKDYHKHFDALIVECMVVLVDHMVMFSMDLVVFDHMEKLLMDLVDVDHKVMLELVVVVVVHMVMVELDLVVVVVVDRIEMFVDFVDILIE